MTAAAAFLAGYAPRVATVYFNRLTLLDEASRAADLELWTRIGEERDRVDATRDEALARLDQTENLLDGLGITGIHRPEDTSQLEAWGEAVFAAASKAFPRQSADAVAHLLGYVLGEGVATLDALAVLSRLAEVASPDHLWIRIQGDSLERERATAERRLGRLASHPLLPDAVQVATALAAHAVSDAAPSGGHAGRAARADAAALTLAEQATIIESAFL